MFVAGDGSWAHFLGKDGPPVTVVSGQSNAIDRSPGGSNLLGMVARGDAGEFFVNGLRVARLSLGGLKSQGFVNVGNNFVTLPVAGAISFQNFTVSSVDSASDSIVAIVALVIGALAIVLFGAQYWRGKAETRRVRLRLDQLALIGGDVAALKETTMRSGRDQHDRLAKLQSRFEDSLVGVGSRLEAVAREASDAKTISADHAAAVTAAVREMEELRKTSRLGEDLLVAEYEAKLKKWEVEGYDVAEVRATLEATKRERQ